MWYHVYAGRAYGVVVGTAGLPSSNEGGELFVQTRAGQDAVFG